LPRFSESQENLLRFLAGAHEESAQINGEKGPVAKMVQRFGVKDGRIARRYFDCEDYYLPPEARKIFPLAATSGRGAWMQERMQAFQERAVEVFREFYPAGAEEPEHLMHVTCTGYFAPSAAQLLVAERAWDAEITHAYHMGCYAALPTIRLAAALSDSRRISVDIAHTEICTLHMDPGEHRIEQIVVQSLFADGHIRYRVLPDKPAVPSLRVLAIREGIAPESATDMSWIPGARGMMMELSREVPNKIAGQVRQALLSVARDSGISLEEIFRRGKFAVHPGGPRIVDCVQGALELRDEQVSESRAVLRDRGNMSSATLPHIWQEILAARPDPGTPVVSFAFGPGLTIFTSVFEVAS
jgi:predicted naringenin-chalcone synthase